MSNVKEIEKAVEFTKKKDFKSAEKIYNNILKNNPDDDTVLFCVGLLYINQYKFKKAEKYLNKGYSINKSDNIVYHLAITKYYLNKYNEAIYYLKKCLKSDKKNQYSIFKMLLDCFHIIEDYGNGYMYAEMARKEYPLDETVLERLVFFQLNTGRFKECQQYLNILLKKYPKNTNAWFTQGLLIEVLSGDEKKARECYQKMIDYGDKLSGYLHMGISLIKSKDTRKQGYLYFNKVKRINPNEDGLSFCYASYFLSNRQFKRGYKYYTKPDILKNNILKIFQKSNNYWDGKPYLQETLLVFGDQGLGDNIQFCRYLPFVAKKFKNVKVLVDKSLITIFKHSFSKYKNIKFYEINKTFPHYDKYTMMSWLLYYLNINFNNIPCTLGYLSYKKSLKEKYKKEYFNNDNLKIGICWEPGGIGFRDAIHRMINIELFEDIINLNGTSVYSFQVDSANDNYKKYTNLIDISPSFKNFDDTAAALKNIDLLVTIDTSTAHLAGALGVKTFMLLPYCTDWRWFDNTQKTEWYDSVTIFKQQKPMDWDITLSRVLNAIKQEYFK